MALKSGFFNSVDGDRRYDAVAFSELFDGILRDGVLMSIGTQFRVEASEGMRINVGVGRAWFDRTWTSNSSVLPITVEQSEVLQDRIDTVVIDVNIGSNVRNNDIIIIKGTPSMTPVRPSLIRSLQHNQYPLADIRVNRGVTTITQSNISNRVGTGDCPFVTGILDTVNVDSLLTQWENQWELWFSENTVNYYVAFNLWFNSLQNWFNENIADFDNEFNTWFQSVKDILMEIEAGNIMILLEALQSKTPTATIGTIEHTLNYYPICTLHSVHGAVAVTGAGMTEAGGGNLFTVPAEFELDGFNTVTVKTVKEFTNHTDIQQISPTQYAFIDPTKATSLFLMLR